MSMKAEALSRIKDTYKYDEYVDANVFGLLISIDNLKLTKLERQVLEEKVQNLSFLLGV